MTVAGTLLWVSLLWMPKRSTELAKWLSVHHQCFGISKFLFLGSFSYHLKCRPFCQCCMEAWMFFNLNRPGRTYTPHSLIFPLTAIAILSQIVVTLIIWHTYPTTMLHRYCLLAKEVVINISIGRWTVIHLTKCKLRNWWQICLFVKQACMIVCDTVRHDVSTMHYSLGLLGSAWWLNTALAS